VLANEIKIAVLIHMFDAPIAVLKSALEKFQRFFRLVLKRE
jgi:hypothetical protein